MFSDLFYPTKILRQNGDSMLPTLQPGQQITLVKTTTDINRGDIVAFKAPESAQCPPQTGCEFIKRIIAIPGDRLLIQGNAVILNGRSLDERYILPHTITVSGSFTNNGEVVVPPGQYFVLGDNRAVSSDSRNWGYVPKNNVIGVAK
jgi:signal peptidase I